jgi:hypothetical protein
MWRLARRGYIQTSILAMSAMVRKSFKEFLNRFKALLQAIPSNMSSRAMGPRDVGNDSDKVNAK